jgi:hypothetical protein
MRINKEASYGYGRQSMFQVRFHGRTGAPVEAYCRIAAHPIRLREPASAGAGRYRTANQRLIYP